MLKKHSINIKGHQTSFTLENEFWLELKQIAKNQSTSLTSIISEIDQNRDSRTNLSSALRLFVLKKMKNSTQLLK